MVAEQAQYWPEILAAQQVIADGGIGEVLTARAKFWESAAGEWGGDYVEGTWRSQKRFFSLAMCPSH